ncbi:MAG: hypothetical protein N5P05_000022 [Chroococcopsis gigantea SAG 12.99]|jgi:hypothetical protein|nr:hypothetical protein [Chroococcopsis gigantea SAG 12.99]
MLKNKIDSSLFRSLGNVGQTGVTLLMLLIILSILQLGSRVFTRLDAWFSPAVPKIETTSLIINQIRSVSQLTTSIFVMETVVPTSQERKLGDFVIGETKLLYIAQGEVRAGINLDKLTADNVKIHGKDVIIQLPAPEILDSKIDVSQSKVYDYDRGFLGLGPDVAPQLQTLAQQETLKRVTKAACQQGILKEANKKAQLAITGLLTTAGYEKVEIISKESKSCQ